MADVDTPAGPGFDYSRSEPFSYTCNRCRRCCYGKRIPLNPYDLVRLAAALGTTTGEVIGRYTEDGVVLKNREDVPGEPCVFLGEQGCNVHTGRPAACRVYPLGRTSNLDGDERFAVLQPHPQTEGCYGTEGTIGDFVESQGATPYFEASRRYLQLFTKLAAAGALLEAAASADTGLDTHVLDVDATLATYCQSRGIELPTDPMLKIILHIEAVEAMLEALDGTAAQG